MLLNFEVPYFFQFTVGIVRSKSELAKSKSWSRIRMTLILIRNTGFFYHRWHGSVGLELEPDSELSPFLGSSQKNGGSGCITLLPSESFILSEEMVFNLYDYCYLLHV